MLHQLDAGRRLRHHQIGSRRSERTAGVGSWQRRDVNLSPDPTHAISGAGCLAAAMRTASRHQCSCTG